MRYLKCFINIICIFIICAAFSVHAAEAPPIGQSKPRSVAAAPTGIKADIFGQKGGRYHPFLMVEEVYTDNLFATHSSKKSDFITTIAPGIWLAFPANREKLLSIDTTTTSPGGLKLSRIKPEATRRYQTYLLYSPEIILYSGHSSQDHVNHKAEGLVQYNFNSGLSLDLIDIFHDKEEIAGNGVTDTLYRFQDNLLDFMSTYETRSGKLKLKFEYSNYDLDYKDAIVDYRDRNDNTFGISAFYKFWPKTSIFAEYDHAIINFDSGSANDSVENHYYGGVNWDITAKTKGRLKLGYMDKDFDSPAVSDQDDFSIELQTQHNLTAKRGLLINGYRKFHESDLATASSFLSTGIDINLLQRFTPKWSGTFSFTYEQNRYNGIDRDDDLYRIGPALRFKPRKWLIFDFGYFFTKNDSNMIFYDYEANQIFLRATLSM